MMLELISAIVAGSLCFSLTRSHRPDPLSGYNANIQPDHLRSAARSGGKEDLMRKMWIGVALGLLLAVLGVSVVSATVARGMYFQVGEKQVRDSDGKEAHDWTLEVPPDDRPGALAGTLTPPLGAP
jgi:hypothetical protein